MNVKTRGQITLIATPEYRVNIFPPSITIATADDGGTFDGKPFEQIFTFKAVDNLNQPLTITGVSLITDNGTSPIKEKDSDGNFIYKFTKTNEELKQLEDSGHLNFYVILENESIGAEDDYFHPVSFSFAKAKSGRDGTPAYGVNLYTENQIFIRSLDENGSYIFEPSQIDLKTELINFTEEQKKKVSYKWYLNNIEIGQGATYPITPSYNSETQTVNGTGMYEVKVYYDDTFYASDILGIASAASGTESFTVLLTNDSEIVSVDRDDYTIDSGQVSTGILVYKGAERVTNFDVILGEDSGNDADGPYEEVLNNITFKYNKDNQTITGTYGKGVTIGEKLKITINVGDTSFIKYFYAKASLAGESAKMIKITGPQFFQVDGEGVITPDEIQLMANPQNVEMGEWSYWDGSKPVKIEEATGTFLTISKGQNNNGHFAWPEGIDILEIRVTDSTGKYSDTYPIYKIKSGKDSCTVIPSNETISIITDAFGRTVEDRRYEINITSFLGTQIVNHMINNITYDENLVHASATTAQNLIIEVSKEKIFYTTSITFRVKIDGVQKSILKTIYLQPAQQGADAKVMKLSGNQIFKYSVSTSNFYDPKTTITCQTNVPYFKWKYAIKNKDEDSTNLIFKEYNSSLRSNSTFDIIVSENNATFPEWVDLDQTVILKTVECDYDYNEVENGIFDEISIYKYRDGSNGADAVISYPTNENIIITEGEDGNIVSQSFECDVVGFWGSKNITPEIVVENNYEELFNISDDKINSTNLARTITIQAKNISTSGYREEDKRGSIKIISKIKDPDNSSNIFTFNFFINWSIIKGGVEGNGIEEIINYYYASNSNDSNDIPSIGSSRWTKNSIPSNYNTTNKYLWNYEFIKYSKFEEGETSTPFIIGVYGKEGKDGVGITKIEQYYRLNNDKDTPPSNDNIIGWEIDPSAPTTNQRFLWSFEIIHYSDGSSEKKSVRLIGSLGKDGEQGPKGDTGDKGDKGDKGNPGEDGKTIESITSYYIENQSSSDAPTLPTSLTNLNGWDTTVTLNSPNNFIWTIDYLLYNDNSFSFTNARLDLGTRSDKVAQGMYNGDFNLSQLVDATMTNATLNKKHGLIIEGTDNGKTYKLEENANSLGIYRNNDLKFGTYTDNAGEASILLKGTIYADRGKIGTLRDTDDENKKIGWTILGSEKDKDTGIYSPAAIYSGDRNSLKSKSEGVYIGTDGLNLGADGQTNLKFGYEDEINSDGTVKKVGKLTICGNIEADSLTIKENIEVEKIDGLSKTFIRSAAGIYNGTGNEGPSSAVDGDLYIQYTSGNVSSSGSTSKISISGTSTTFSPSIPDKGYAVSREAQGKTANWNFWKDSSSQTSPGSSYAKVGRASTSYKNGSCRMSITPEIKGANSVSSFTINITGRSGLSGGSIYDSNAYSGNGTATVKVYNSPNSTTPIAESTFSLGAKTTTNKTYSVDLQGQIISGTTYYVTITASLGSLLYVKEIAFSGTTSAVSSFSPSIKLKSSGQWYSLGAEGNLIKDANTTYTLSLSGTNLILTGSDNTTSSVTLPTGTTYSSGNGININGTTVSVSSDIYGYGANNSRNAITFQSGGIPSGGKNGDICFVYEV